MTRSTWRRFWDHYWRMKVTLGPLWGQFGVTFGVWGSLWTTLGSLWKLFGVTCQPERAHKQEMHIFPTYFAFPRGHEYAGPSLRKSEPGHFQVILGSVWEPKRVGKSTFEFLVGYFFLCLLSCANWVAIQCLVFWLSRSDAWTSVNFALLWACVSMVIFWKVLFNTRVASRCTCPSVSMVNPVFDGEFGRCSYHPGAINNRFTLMG